MRVAAALLLVFLLPVSARATEGQSSLVLGLNIERSSEQRIAILLDTARTLRQRLQAQGIHDATVVAIGEDRILVRLPASAALNRLIPVLTRPSMLSIRLVDPAGDLIHALQGQVPAGDELLWQAGDDGLDTLPFLVQRETLIPGNAIENATAGFDHVVGLAPVVTVTLDMDSANRLADIARVHPSGTFAIVRDGKVLATGAITSPITNGMFEISGGYSNDSAETLALILNAASAGPLIVVKEEPASSP